MLYNVQWRSASSGKFCFTCQQSEMSSDFVFWVTWCHSPMSLISHTTRLPLDLLTMFDKDQGFVEEGDNTGQQLNQGVATFKQQAIRESWPCQILNLPSETILAVFSTREVLTSASNWKMILHILTDKIRQLTSWNVINIKINRSAFFTLGLIFQWGAPRHLFVHRFLDDIRPLWIDFDETSNKSVAADSCLNPLMRFTVGEETQEILHVLERQCISIAHTAQPLAGLTASSKALMAL